MLLCVNIRFISGFFVCEMDARKRVTWAEEEETLLIQEVQKRSDVLFGSMKGDGCVKKNKIKLENWQAIANMMNAQFTSNKRSAEECRKKYYNAKQRAKEKVDSMRHPKTGGGPAPPMLSHAEETLLQVQGETPSFSGIGEALDSDVVIPTTSKSFSLQEEASVACTDEGKEACMPESTESSPNENRSNIKIKDRSMAAQKRSHGRITSKSLQVLQQQNLLLDNERIKHETKKIKLQCRKLELQIQKLQGDINLQGIAQGGLILDALTGSSTS